MHGLSRAPLGSCSTARLAEAVGGPRIPSIPNHAAACGGSAGSREEEMHVEARSKAVMVIADGRCKFIGEAKWNEVGYAQEPLPEEMRMLLCLIDGAERRQNLLRSWSGRAPVTAPLAANIAKR